LKLFKIILTLLLAIFISGCTRSYFSSNYPSYYYPPTRQEEPVRVTEPVRSNQEVRAPVVNRYKSYTARVDIDGDVSYVDRKYFRQSFSEVLYRNHILSDYNSPNKIDVRIIVTVRDSKTSGGDSYQNCSAYKLDRKAQGAVIYTIKGKGYYTNSVNFKFNVKSASCVSFDDAELKARKLLYRRLGEITGSKVVKYKSKLIRNRAGCKIR